MSASCANGRSVTKGLARFCAMAGIAVVAIRVAAAPSSPLTIDSPMPAPEWARLERRLLADNVPACREFFAKYYDERGYLQCFVRWGANDGPDDAFENFNRWPELHALGARRRDPRSCICSALGGHDPPVLRGEDDRRAGRPRRACTYKEFSVQSDWMHHGEGLQLFNRMALSAPRLPAYRERARRFAALYMGEDPDAPNYDPQKKAHPLDDQRQPRPDAAEGDGARLGRRSVRRRRLRRAARREHLRAVPRALPGIHRRRRRSLPQPRRHDAADQRLSARPARRSTGAGSSTTWTRGWRG